MNHVEIYKQATTPQGLAGRSINDEEKAKEAARSAAVRLEEDLKRAQWLNDKYTQQVLKELRDKRNEFNQQAITQATTYPTHNNHQQIVQLLQQVATIDNLLATYARPNN
jgi:vacuolar-type H+-ATPase subunit H